jgi:hypothetical protein
MTKATFVALYEATTFDGPDFEVIAKPIKIEFFHGSREFQVVGQFTRVVTAPRSGQLMIGGNMLIRTAPDRHHLAIFARVDLKSPPDDAMAIADELIDEAICKLACERKGPYQTLFLR